MTVNIRPITAADAPGFRAVLDAVAAERRWLAFLEAPPLTQLEGFVADNIAHGWPQWVAEADGRIVGWCDITPYRKLPGFAHTGVLGMGVAEDWRGRGIGRRLLEACMAAAPAAGFTRVQLHVYAANTRAFELYRKAGFAIEGLLRNYRQLPDGGEDCWLLAWHAPGSVAAAKAGQVTLVELTADNLRGYLDLDVNQHQRRLVAPNAISVAQAHFAPHAWFRGIAVGGQPAGFVMLYDPTLAPDPETEDLWLWRFMVDARFQGSGVGAAALRQVIAHAQSRPGITGMKTSHVDAPGNPGKFYEKQGFAYTGAADDSGELEMQLKF